MAKSQLSVANLHDFLYWVVSASRSEDIGCIWKIRIWKIWP